MKDLSPSSNPLVEVHGWMPNRPQWGVVQQVDEIILLHFIHPN